MNWYASTLVNLHIDNHSDIIGREFSKEELTELFRSLNVDVIQVSAMGNRGTELTYPSDRLPELVHPELGDYDMVGRFGEAIRDAGKRFFIYINTRGLGLDVDHPDWVQLNSEGKGSAFKGGNDMCARPTPEANGFLEVELLPLLTELTERYEPDGFWVDGDHARLPACYCNNCREAFRRAGQAEPEEAPTREWMSFQLDRRDEYKRMMADAVHRVRPEALYCSNHSYRNTYTSASRNIDPRSAPEWVGYLSADLSHGDAVRQTRILAMSLSAEEETAHDIMHLVGSRVSPQRFLQQGGLTLASGSPWFLWGGHTFVDAPDDQENVRRCVEFVRSRESLLVAGEDRDEDFTNLDAPPPTTSANIVAVVASEGLWRAVWPEGTQMHQAERANTVACALQDAGYPVDLVNEQMLRSRCGFGRPRLLDDEDILMPYRVVFVPEREALAQETLESLELLTESGTAVVPLPVGPVPDPDWDGVIIELMRNVGIGPALVLNDSDRHLVFALRSRNSGILLHITDITSEKDGARVLPSVRDEIDDHEEAQEFTLSLAVAHAPSNVRSAPATTPVASTYDGGVLRLRVSGFQTHAVVELVGMNPGDVRCFSTETTGHHVWSSYPTDLRSEKTSRSGIEHGHIV